MKNVSVNVSISNADVSTMLVQGHMERLQTKLADLNSQSKNLESMFHETMGDLDDTIAEVAAKATKEVRRAIAVLNKSYRTKFFVDTSWRRLKLAHNKIHFNRSTGKLTPEGVTASYWADIFDFSFPMKNSSSFSPSYHLEIPEGMVAVPYPILEHDYVRESFQAQTLVSINKEIETLVEKAKDLANKWHDVVYEIDRIERELENPETITRKVTARLTQATLSEAGDLGFIGKIINSMDTPLMLGNSNE